MLRRHSSEDLFGVQICGAYPDTVARTVELIEQECTIDFIDINMGCPIDIVVNKGAGSALLTKPMRMKSIVEVASGTAEKPITIKVFAVLNTTELDTMIYVTPINILIAYSLSASTFSYTSSTTSFDSTLPSEPHYQIKNPFAQTSMHAQ